MNAITPIAIDRAQTVHRVRPTDCCPPDLCSIDPCGIVCSFVEALPRGPLWDRAKAEAVDRYRAGACESRSCGPTMVDYAVFAGRHLHHMLMDALWPAIRESNPETAYDTIDDWLDRLGWRDCFDCACRDPDIGAVSPIEVLGHIDGCDVALCCPPEFPADLVCAVRKGIVHSLSRLRLGAIRNVYGINAVIAPLGARVAPVCWRWIELDPRFCRPDDGRTDAGCGPAPIDDDPCAEPVVDPWQCPEAVDCTGQDTLGADCGLRMRQYQFRVEPISDHLPACVKLTCLPDQDSPRPVTAYYDTTSCDAAGLPQRIWPGLMAAECIVRSLAPPGARIKITRGC
jgi:hypothetical protein